MNISETMIDMLQIYSVSALEPSPSCDHLAFVKHVFYWYKYKLSNDVFVQCRFYQQNNQLDTKSARRLLMLSDEKTTEQPDEGFKIKKNSGSFEQLWNIATASYDWTILTGIDTGSSGDEIIIDTQPARTFMVWGISFHKEQFELRNPNGLSLQMAYNYFKDVTTGAYGAGDMRNPTNLEDGKHTFTINPSDLDDLGNYYFNDADGNPLVLTMSTLYLNLESGILNFDLIGTDLNYGGMATGTKSSGSNYLFHTETIDSFWVKGTLNINKPLQGMATTLMPSKFLA